MITSHQLSPGMTISIDDKIYRVESCVKVTVAKGTPAPKSKDKDLRAFIKTKLKNLMSEEVIEKNFPLDQTLQDVSLTECKLEYLYLEDQDYLFLDTGNIELVLVPADVIGDKVNFLKEGVEVKAMFYGKSIFSVELPQFLELMVATTENTETQMHGANATKTAVLETGAKLEVPLFVGPGDIVKVDTHVYGADAHKHRYVQRI